jgi:4-amino-4-deoxy-L-arabinose transferase-like glycosyltransferase
MDDRERAAERVQQLSLQQPAASSGNMDRQARNLPCLALAACLFVVVLLSLLVTSRDLAMVQDEPFTINGVRYLAQWFSALAHPPAGSTRADLFAHPVLDESWPFSREQPNCHPPFYALLSLAGWWLTRGWVDPLLAYRVGAMVLTSATASVLCLFICRRLGWLAGLAAGLFLVYLPRNFSYAHYAHWDMPLSCLWLLAQVAFLKALRSSRWIPVFGLALGLAAGTKFTGLLAVVPPLAWVALFEWLPFLWRRAGARGPQLSVSRTGPHPELQPIRRWAGTMALGAGIVIAALVLYAIQPHWWSDPLRSVERFLRSNLTREKTIPIASLYLGRVYPFSLPWHNTLVITAVTTPALVLVAALGGIVACLARARSQPERLIWVLSWGVLMVVRALPSAPGHHLERLILPSIASLSVLAAVGIGELVRRLRPRRLGWIAVACVMLALGECGLGFAQTYPYHLSYFSQAIGGLRGAQRLGLDATYYWDTMGPEFLGWVRERAQAEPLELHFQFGLLNVILLREWGLFPRNVHVTLLDPTSHPDYVIQRSPGTYSPYDRWLARNGHPIYAIRRQGVELLRVYAFPELKQACKATGAVPGFLQAGPSSR